MVVVVVIIIIKHYSSFFYYYYFFPLEIVDPWHGMVFNYVAMQIYRVYRLACKGVDGWLRGRDWSTLCKRAIFLSWCAGTLGAEANVSLGG